MIGVAAVVVGATALIVLVAFLLPCPACEKRRARMRAAIEEWKRRH